MVKAVAVKLSSRAQETVSESVDEEVAVTVRFAAGDYKITHITNEYRCMCVLNSIWKSI